MNIETGYILHRGMTNGKSFVAIATLESRNVKTGNMVQIWFLLEHTSPIDGVKSGLDAFTICRDCIFASGNGCYVEIGRAPTMVWKKFKACGYPELNHATIHEYSAAVKFVLAHTAILHCYLYRLLRLLHPCPTAGQAIFTIGGQIH